MQLKASRPSGKTIRILYPVSRRNQMIYNEVRKMAKGMGINTYRMRKTDMILRYRQLKTI
jgi:hypothetical protein